MAEADATGYRTLSVIVPVFNERNTIGEIVRRMRQVVLPLDLEIVVVDDGSDDGTDKVLAAIEDSTVRMVRHPVNRGKGAAIRTGLERARGDIVLIQDADLEYDPADWPRLVQPVLRGTSRVVYGSRFSGERMNVSLQHWAANRLLSVVADVVYDTTVSDVLTGYKVFDRRILDDITLTSDRFEFEPEFTAKVLRSGHRIYEVPVAYTRRARDEGTKYGWSDWLSAFWSLVRYRWQ